MSLTALDAASCLRFDELVPVLVVPQEPQFETLRDWLRDCVPTIRDRLPDGTMRLDLGDREIKLFDLRRMIHLLREEFRIEVTGLYVRPAEIHRYAERELKLRLFAVQAPPPAPAVLLPVAELAPEVKDPPSETIEVTLPEPEEPTEEEPVAQEGAPTVVETTPVEQPQVSVSKDPESNRRTLTVHKTLRSGNAVRFDGDIILFGDVNPGGQVVAAGNIVVLGALRDIAHAGATGDDSAFVLSSDLRPTQIRIARKIAIPPTRAEANLGGTEIARIVGDEITIETWRGKNRTAS